MVDLYTVCCMCGDIGFPDQLFRCSKCSHRFQHLYCSNYYEESKPIPTEICDWCLCEEKNTSCGKLQGIILSSSPPSSSKKLSSKGRHSSHGESPATSNKSPRRGDEKNSREDSNDDGNHQKGKNLSSSPKPTGRRYKLLKDVLY